MTSSRNTPRWWNIKFNCSHQQTFRSVQWVLDRLARVPGSHSWSRRDNMLLVLQYQKYIENPNHHSIRKLKSLSTRNSTTGRLMQLSTNKSTSAIYRHLNRIHNSNDEYLKRCFRRNPREWTSIDERDFFIQLMVPFWHSCMIKNLAYRYRYITDVHSSVWILIRHLYTRRTNLEIQSTYQGKARPQSTCVYQK